MTDMYFSCSITMEDSSHLSNLDCTNLLQMYLCTRYPELGYLVLRSIKNLPVLST